MDNAMHFYLVKVSSNENCPKFCPRDLYTAPCTDLFTTARKQLKYLSLISTFRFLEYFIICNECTATIFL